MSTEIGIKLYKFSNRIVTYFSIASVFFLLYASYMVYLGDIFSTIMIGLMSIISACTAWSGVVTKRAVLRREPDILKSGE